LELSRHLGVNWAKRHLAHCSHVLSDGLACFRFNRRLLMSGMTERIANAVCCCMPLAERDLRVAEAYG
jgi:hypothetical protein